MPILSGSASLTRFNVASSPRVPDLDAQAFREIAPGSEARESMGFLPFEAGGPYELAGGKIGFRVRFDTVTPDPTAVRERLRDLVRVERENAGERPVSGARRRELRQLAEEELVPKTPSRSRIVECVIADRVLHVGTASNSHLGKVVQLLRKVNVVVDFKTPWIDLGEGEAQSEVLSFADPLLSAHGAHFLRALLEDEEIKLEPVGGYARLQTRYARVSLSGAVLRDVYGYLEDDSVELVAAKLVVGDRTFNLDGPSFRISGASLGRVAGGHWSELLEARLEQIVALWDLLDRKYGEHRRRPRRRPSALSAKVVPIGPAGGGAAGRR